MSDKKLLLFTFDYELFLGERSGTVQECLINPTNKLIARLNKYDFKAVFFIDTVYLLRLKEISSSNRLAKDDLEAITDQLVQLVKKGHEIHLHIHPHWMDAKYNPEINEWSLSEKRYYSFASISNELRKDLFDKSVYFIRSILDLSGSGQPIDSYRAGGWSIQPFENFRPFFIQYRLMHEWSVIPGKYQHSDAHGFDFREAPKHNDVYQFDEDPCRKKEHGPFTEWTISSITMNRYEKWFDFKISALLHRLGKRPPNKGKTVSNIIKEEGDSFIKKDQKRMIASFEGLNYFTVKKYQSAIRHAKYFQFISHPKLISPYEFNMMDKLFRTLKKGNELETDFRKAVFE